MALTIQTGQYRRAALSDEYCSHAKSRVDLCELCLEDSRTQQPTVWRMIEELLVRSTFRRVNGPNATISRGEENYSLRLLHPQQVSEIRRVHNLIRTAFTVNEVEPYACFHEGVAGILLPSEQQRTMYRVFVAEQGGEIQAVYAGSLVRLSTEKEAGESVFVGSYAFTLPQSRGRGIARELFVSAMIQAAADACATNSRIVAVVGDCTAASEEAWNSMGRARVYVEKQGEYSEVPFLLPPQRFTPSGIPADDAGQVPEHFMIRTLDGVVDKDVVIRAIQAVYRWNSRLPSTHFENQEAYQRYLRYFDALLEEVVSVVQRGVGVVAWTRTQREEARRGGVRISDHGGADEFDWG